MRRGGNSKIVSVGEFAPKSKVWGKTTLMLAIEARYKRPIEELLDPRLPLAVVSIQLGVEQSTVSKWRKRLGLR